MKPIGLAIYNPNNGEVDTGDFDCYIGNQKNEADFRNEAAKALNNPYILFLKAGGDIDTDSIEEIAECALEFEPDIVYSNMIVKNGDSSKIENLTDWESREAELIQSLDLSMYVPKWGTAIKKELMLKRPFDPELGPETFYEFVYLHLNSVSLKLCETSFFEVSEEKKDPTFYALLLKRIRTKYGLRELFGKLNWENEPVALATAYTLLGDKLFEKKIYKSGAEYYKKALLSFHNQESLKKLIVSLIYTGEFSKAKNLCEKKVTDPATKENLEFHIQKSSQLVTELEKAAMNGEFENILQAAPQILEYFDGAPVQNVLGVSSYHLKDPRNAFDRFYKAAYMNPANNDIIENLMDTAAVISKTPEATAMLRRISE